MRLVEWPLQIEPRRKAVAVLTIRGLEKSFGGQDVFHNVNLLVNGREKVALIGPNGCGKTTLMRILAGLETPDAGSVYILPGSTVGYLEQQPELEPDACAWEAAAGISPELLRLFIDVDRLGRALERGDAPVEAAHRYAEQAAHLHALGGDDLRARAEAYLGALGFDQRDLETPCPALSGGQRTRVALVRLLLQSPDILLLDEPTNHVDIQGCEWLQEFLCERFPGAAIIVSHDRYFLDAVVSRVLEMSPAGVDSYTGNYSAYAAGRAERDAQRRKQYELQQREIARIEQAIQQLFSQRKFSLRDSKVKQLERIQRVQRVSRQRTMAPHMESVMRSGREVLVLDALGHAFGSLRLFANVNYVLERGRKIGIVGPNGSGKSTFLRICAGLLEPGQGSVIPGVKVQPVYFAQQFEHLDSRATVLEELLKDADLDAHQARDLLGRMLFSGDDVFKRVEVLSGGELCRLALAKVLAARPNLLLLDEPTNHLDIASREALEEALKRSDATMLIASHDRYLLDAVADGIMEIDNGAWRVSDGNYTDYRRSRRPDAAGATPAAKPVSASPRPYTRAARQQARQLKQRQRELEDHIAALEAQRDTLTARLQDEQTYKDGEGAEAARAFDAVEQQLSALLQEWEQVSERLLETQ